jgi:hypothetical protein
VNKVAVVLKFNSGYIGKPYWPELNTLINITKDVHPKLGDTRKQAAILAACEKRGITPEEYQRIVRDASRPFYTRNGLDSEIVIPERIIQSFINNCSQVSPKAIPRVPAKGLTFIAVKLDNGHLSTGKTVADAKRFERFVKNQESNQRMFCSDLYIDNFQATGMMLIDTSIIESEKLLKLFEYGGRFIGIGGARPQGFGRFQVVRWEDINV